MNAEILLKHFDRISEAPDVVARLRRFILDLAVRGKLVEQDPNEEPVSELLKRIQAEKAQLIKEGLVKNDKPMQSIGSEEIPFKAPKTWSFVRLGDVLMMVNGRAFKPTDWLDSGLPIVRIQNLNNAQASFNYCDPSSVDSRHLISDDTFLISWSGTPGTSFGAFIWKRGLAALNQHIFRCVQIGQAFVPEFLRLAINGQLDVLISKAQGGVGLQHVTKRTLEVLPIPLPPLAEQHRIVAKVDELMALCDQLEDARNDRETQRDRLVTASLHRIGTSPAVEGEDQEDGQTVTTLPAAARFHLDHLPRLTTRVEHIKQLRQTILNLAVFGGLSHSVEWPRTPNVLSEVAKLQNGYAFKSEWFAPEGIRLLRNVNVSHGTIRWDELKYLPIERADEYERFQLFENDIVLSLDRPFIVTGTKVARVRSQDLPCLLLQRVGRFQLDSELLNSDYLFLWVHSPHFLGQIDPGRSNGVPHISSKQVEAAKIFIPSLAEQHRIVAKVDELMALCDQLEAQLTTTETDSRRLLEAVLQEALGNADVGQQMQPLRSLSQAETSAAQARRVDKEGVKSGPSVSTIDQVDPKPLAASRNIPGAILAHLSPGREYSRAEILTAIDLSETDWTWAIRQLKAEGRVVQKGEKRGARYVLA